MKTLLIAGYDSQTRNYQKAFQKLGISCETLDSFSPSTHCDGLLLPGGGDIAPSLLAASLPAAPLPAALLPATPLSASRSVHPSSDLHSGVNWDEALDFLQASLFQEFLAQQKPILGICKGLQLINVCLGGSLIKDLPSHSRSLHTAAPDGSDRLHPTKAAAHTFPCLLYGKSPLTNSAHHQAILQLGEDLRVAQYSEDFVIEAIYHEKLPILGVQWHPERMCLSFAHPQLADGLLLLHYFSTLL